MLSSDVLYFLVSLFYQIINERIISLQRQLQNIPQYIVLLFDLAIPHIVLNDLNVVVGIYINGSFHSYN